MRLLGFFQRFLNLFRRSYVKLPVETVEIGRLRWMQRAYSYVGLREIEGVKSNPKIDEWLKAMHLAPNDEIPWCSAACNGILAESGMHGSGKPNARSFLLVGLRCDFKPGCIVILWRGSINGWQGHVGFAEKLSDDGRKIRVLGGNQGDEFNSAWYSIDRVLGYRWPVSK